MSVRALTRWASAHAEVQFKGVPQGLPDRGRFERPFGLDVHGLRKAAEYGNPHRGRTESARFGSTDDEFRIRIANPASSLWTNTRRKEAGDFEISLLERPDHFGPDSAERAYLEGMRTDLDDLPAEPDAFIARRMDEVDRSKFTAKDYDLT